MSSRDLIVQMDELLDEVSKEVEEAIDTAFRDESKETVKRLKSTSPKKYGDYAKSWTSKKVGTREYVVYNKNHWQITWLLENGHVVRNKRGTFGRAPAFPHIKPAEEEAQSQVVEIITRSLD